MGLIETQRRIAERRSAVAEEREVRRSQVVPNVAEARATAEEALGLIQAEPVVGMVVSYEGDSDPPGGKWMLRNGRVLSRAGYPEYFALVGTRYNTGGEGDDSFRMADARHRVSVMAGSKAGFTQRVLGALFGSETVAMTWDQMPQHAHEENTGYADHSHNYTRETWANVTAPADSGSRSIPSNMGTTTDGTSSNNHRHTIATSGLGDPHPNHQPSIADNSIVRVLP